MKTATGAVFSAIIGTRGLLHHATQPVGPRIHTDCLKISIEVHIFEHIKLNQVTAVPRRPCPPPNGAVCFISKTLDSRMGPRWRIAKPARRPDCRHWPAPRKGPDSPCPSGKGPGGRKPRGRSYS